TVMTLIAVRSRISRRCGKLNPYKFVGQSIYAYYVDLIGRAISRHSRNYRDDERRRTERRDLAEIRASQ
ncbi:hypothetical protein ALC57_12335, partial [Trachymyrmex cornetzi]